MIFGDASSFQSIFLPIDLKKKKKPMCWYPSVLEVGRKQWLDSLRWTSLSRIRSSNGGDRSAHTRPAFVLLAACWNSNTDEVSQSAIFMSYFSFVQSTDRLCTCKADVFNWSTELRCEQLALLLEGLPFHIYSFCLKFLFKDGREMENTEGVSSVIRKNCKRLVLCWTYFM